MSSKQSKQRLVIRVLLALIALGALASIPALVPAEFDAAKANVVIDRFHTEPQAPVLGRENRYSVRVTGEEGRPVTGAKVEAHLTMPAMNHTSTERAVHSGGGIYRGKLALTMLGVWELRVVVDDGRHQAESRYRFSYQAKERSFAVQEVTAARPK